MRKTSSQGEHFPYTEDREGFESLVLYNAQVTTRDILSNRELSQKVLLIYMQINCRKCGVPDLEGNFPFKNKAMGIRRLVCKKCTRLYHQSYREQHTEKYGETRKRWKMKTKDFIQKLKAAPCFDCKIEYPYYVMQFDHLDGHRKLLKISSMFRAGKQAILDEIQKCELVCANCHAERTHQRWLQTKETPNL